MDQDVAAFKGFNVVQTFFQASEPNRLKGLGIKNRTSARTVNSFFRFNKASTKAFPI